VRNYLIIIFLVLVSCNGQKKAIAEDSTTVSKFDSSLELLVQDEYVGFDTAETMVIRDEKRLRSFYSKINRTRKPGLPVPIIDFSKEMVIVQCSGTQNYSGLPILLFGKETEDQVFLDSKINEDTSDTSTALYMSPFCVYKMSLTKKEIVVKRNHE